MLTRPPCALTFCLPQRGGDRDALLVGCHNPGIDIRTAHNRRCIGDDRPHRYRRLGCARSEMGRSTHCAMPAGSPMTRCATASRNRGPARHADRCTRIHDPGECADTQGLRPCFCAASRPCFARACKCQTSAEYNRAIGGRLLLGWDHQHHDPLPVAECTELRASPGPLIIRLNDNHL